MSFEGAVNTQDTGSKVAQVVRISPPKEWRLYDSFSQPVRKLLQDAPIDIDCSEVRRSIDMFGVEATLVLYQKQLAEWVAEYRASFNAVPAEADEEPKPAPLHGGIRYLTHAEQNDPVPR